jgi:hypothetical protein
MADKPTTSLEAPGGVPAPIAADQPEIHVIPERFYGAALKQKIKPVAIPGPAGQAPQVQQGDGGNKAIVIALVVALAVLVAGGAAAYFLLFAKNATPDPVCGNDVCEVPSETPNSCSLDCGAPPPVCGDAKCESPESPYTCSEDCGAPPPVCGDRQCQGDESKETCPIDCGFPDPVCGDQRCDASENFTSCPADCAAPEPIVAQDTDSDGITDLEERDIYASAIDDPDSDHDSYVDLNEILNLFDPSKPPPTTLVDADGIVLYRNVGFGFDIFRPTQWTVTEDADLHAATFIAGTGEKLTVRATLLPERMTLLQWAVSRLGTGRADQIETLNTKQGYAQVFSVDRRKAFVASGNRAYEFTYDLNGQLEIRYRVTFHMMINSLKTLPLDAAGTAALAEDEPAEDAGAAPEAEGAVVPEGAGEGPA